jgi:two-component system alkaline phosphatase synthesis response regulator PhoP
MADENKKRILIIDDDTVALNSLKELLALSGYAVETIQDTKGDIMHRIKAFSPHIILLDLLMPHIGGFEVCELLNKDKETQGIPVIIVSALLKEADVKRAYRLGIIGSVTKPYDFSKLLQEINKALASKENA